MAKENPDIRVLIVDDHTVVRRGLTALLSAPKYGVHVVGEAGDGLSAVEQTRALDPDVILMDLIMPGMSGLETVRLIYRDNRQARILVLTSSGEEETVLQALRAGASGYLLKDASPDELVNAIRSVYYGQMALPQALAQKVILEGAGSAADQDPDPLTERERDVIACIVQGMSNKQIAEALSISTTTVRTHVSNILRKLNLENRTQIAMYARDQNN